MNTLLSINETTVCLSYKPVRCKGIFRGDSPFQFSLPVLLFQLSVSALFDTLFQYCLNPLGQTSFVSQILVGMVVGPYFLGSFNLFRNLIFGPQSYYVGDTFAFFGVMLFLFIVGVKTDLGIMRRPGKKAVAIGLCTFFLPLFVNIFCAWNLRKSIPTTSHLYKHIYWIASFQSLSNFHVIACFLTDLKLLNTELGRLAISSSMVNGCISWCFVMLFFTIEQCQLVGASKYTFFVMCFSVLLLVAIVCYILRPIMFWMVRRTANEHTIKESYIFWVFIMVLGAALAGELIGQHFLFGPMLLGLAVPNGPPLGSALVTKLDSFVTHMLLPLYFVISGSRIDFTMIEAKTLVVVQILACLGFASKILGAMLPSLYWQMPLNESLYLGLIMTAQGIIDVLFLSAGVQLDLIDQEMYSIMVLSAIVFTAFVSPIVKFLYKPTQSYVAYKRTIQHAKPYGELRILACIHQDDHTLSIINLLEATYPNPENPICVYVVHMIDLAGRSAPVLEAHLPGKKKTSQSHESYHIINAFHLYQQQKKENIVIYPFTVISPYSTMHEDVCGLALDKRVSVVILPFQTLAAIHGGNWNNAIRSVNRNILKLAPCSVGLFIDRGTMNSSIHLSSNSYQYTIGVVFIGGQDDREALAYGRRMAKNPSVSLTVVHLIESSTNDTIRMFTYQDFEIVNEFKNDVNTKTKKCLYQEEVVKDSVEVVSVIRGVENTFDLILVGRRHINSSPLLEGLSDWNEFPELGFMGDMLVSSDSKCKVSVLVIQQQAFGGEEILDGKYIQEDSAVVTISSSAKAVPVF